MYVCTVNEKMYVGGRKLSHFTGFTHNVGKSFVVLLNNNKNTSLKTCRFLKLVLKLATYVCKWGKLLRFVETHENQESFLLRKFYCLWYITKSMNYMYIQILLMSKHVYIYIPMDIATGSHIEKSYNYDIAYIIL